jgi:hypothetical protein
LMPSAARRRAASLYSLRARSGSTWMLTQRGAESATKHHHPFHVIE